MSVGGFNTQPPKGGWIFGRVSNRVPNGFNTQPPKGGWLDAALEKAMIGVSTHSRLKAAGADNGDNAVVFVGVSTHSRLKAAGAWLVTREYLSALFQHTAA